MLFGSMRFWTMRLMMTRGLMAARRGFPAMAGLALAILSCGKAHGQVVANIPAGVEVDADGVLRTKMAQDPTGDLRRARIEAAKAGLNPKLAAASKLRKVSLTRLEEELKNRIAQGKRPTDEMQYLAGLTRVEYVFCYPDTKELVIAGPAEGWVTDITGRTVGIHTGRPVVELQDLIVALRAFPPKGKAAGSIGCSIDPTQDGLKALQQYLNQNRPNPSAEGTERFIVGMKEALGQQNVSTYGVPAKSHFAQVLVEADYNMKLIGISLLKPVAGFKSWVDRENPAGISRNAMQRWYFVPDYDCVRVSGDDLAMELVGDGVKLVGADEVVGANGERHSSAASDGASKAFCTEFTKKYPQIAAAMPVYGQLRNLIDLSVAAAFIKQHDLAGKAEWRMTTFADEATVPTESYNAPKTVESAVNAIWKGTHLMTPIGGGVTISPMQALETSHLLKDDGNKLGEARSKVDLQNVPKGQWWWD